MPSDILFSGREAICGKTDLLGLFQEGVQRLFPAAKPLEGPGGNLSSDHTFFLSEGANVIWVEITLRPFSNQDIPDYLSKARKIQEVFPRGMKGLLAAPGFEEGVQGLLGLLRMTVQFLHYESGTAMWIRDITPAPFEISPTEASPYAPAPRALPEAVPFAWNRLSREELREFIQLEIDAAGN